MEKILICIGRAFGSGGHKVGQLLSSELKIPYYDDEILMMAAQRGKMDLKEMLRYDEKKHNDYFYTINFRGNEHAKKGVPAAETLFRLQSEIIGKLAEQGSGIFIGRCADHILRKSGYPVLSAFITAPAEYRIRRVMLRNRIDWPAAKRSVKKKDKDRQGYYEYHTGRVWGAPESYDLYFDSSRLELTEIADRILSALAKGQASFADSKEAQNNKE